MNMLLIPELEMNGLVVDYNTIKRAQVFISQNSEKIVSRKDSPGMHTGRNIVHQYERESGGDFLVTDTLKGF